MRFSRFQLVTIKVLACLVVSGPAHASPGFGSNLELRSGVLVQPKSGPFQAPPSLRGRVDFWKNVFARYGRNQMVVHHREFPQIIFGVLDFTKEASEMGPGELERHKDAVEARTVNGIKQQLRLLGSGQSPETPFQEKLVRIMSAIPGGKEKYLRAADEDLVRTQTGIRERYAEALKRSWKYLPAMEQIFVSEYGLPKELTRVPFIESSFDYTAYSSVGAAGIWQFMPRTAKVHGLMLGKFIDERRDPIKATRAAAEYLKSAFQRLGNWPLAVTSYNHGVAGVAQKVSRSGTNDLAAMIEDPSERYFGFASSNFYPEFLAALEIYDNSDKYFPELNPEPPLKVVSVRLPSSMSATYVARQLGCGIDDLKDSNYAVLDPVWKGKGKLPAGFTLRVPLAYQARLTNISSASPEPELRNVGPTSSSIYGGSSYTVRKGDSLNTIAKRYGTSQDDIVKLNSLKSGGVKVGQQIKVKPSSETVKEKAAPVGSLKKSSKSSQESKVVKKTTSSQSAARKYTVAKGDTIWSISKKLSMSPQSICRANGLKSCKSVKAGTVLQIP